MHTTRVALCLASVLLLTATLSRAQDGRAPGREAQPSTATGTRAATPATPNPGATPPPANGDSAPRIVVEDRMLVVGDAIEARTVPGSAHVLEPAVLRRQAHGDIHRILRMVPGVNLQDEEGYGLRPNIGIRGTGLERSERVTLLEDGVLIAPAPYAAPAAYYFPATGRLEAIEVRKGSAAIEQGPFSHGGVVNLISTSVPTDRLAARLQAHAGEDATRDVLGRVGGSTDRFAWLLEGVRRQSDGFKRLDGGGDTGFSQSDAVGKARWYGRGGSTPAQSLEIKIGWDEQAGHETYLGLTAEDFRRTPRRRYLASSEDRIDTRHEQAQLRWTAQIGPRFDITATAYRNDFFRNWYKLDSVEGRSIAAVLDDADAAPRQLAVLRGDLPSLGDGLAVRANQRDYTARGAQILAGFAARTLAADHQIEAGVRYHEDEEDRFQHDDRWTSSGRSLTLTRAGAPGSQSNQVQSAAAWALHLRDRIAIGRFTVVPGVRIERVDYRRLDYGRADPARTGAALVERPNEVDVALPGLGLSWATPGASTVLFAGAHRGFAPPGPGQDRAVEAEKSWNYEAGARWSGSAGRGRAEVVVFASDYENLLGRDTLAGGGAGTGDLFNGGAARVRGLEASAARTFSVPGGRRFAASVPVRAAYTWTRARFDSTFTTSHDAWAPGVTRGDGMPYIPEHQIAVGAGLDGARLRLFADLSWLAATRSSPGRGTIPEDRRIDDRLTLDLSGEYSLAGRLALHLRVRNATDDVAVVARRPAGLRPALPRTVLAGFTWSLNR